jgi:hypothetical protein
LTVVAAGLTVVAAALTVVVVGLTAAAVAGLTVLLDLSVTELLTGCVCAWS